MEMRTRPPNTGDGMRDSVHDEEFVLPALPSLGSPLGIDTVHTEDALLGPDTESHQPPENGEAALEPRRRNFKSPMLMFLFFLIGFAMSLAHCIVYPKLQGQIVGDAEAQEEKIRFGTAFAFLSQISLTASAWAAYTQWMWRTLKDQNITSEALNAAFEVDRSVLAFTNVEMVKKMRWGSVIALFTWCLLLPPFFTPATLVVYPSTNAETIQTPMPYPNIAYSKFGHKYAYSPPNTRDTTQFNDDTRRTFTGPRTPLNLVTMATASSGEILLIDIPHNNSAYSIDFFAPIVKCTDANTTETTVINKYLFETLDVTVGTVKETDNGYFAFVPTFNKTGHMNAESRPRQQTPAKATNELWMTFLRPILNSTGEREMQRIFQVCRLHNATYQLSISRDRGLQNITKSYTVHETVPFPLYTKIGEISDMALHAYSAFMWSLSDLLVGKFAWYQDIVAMNETDATAEGAAQWGVIDSGIQRTSLLGSLDLDAYFWFDEDRKLYRIQNYSLSDQRLRDKVIAGNRTLDVLIEELSANITVSLMSNRLLTESKLVSVNLTTNVNRYAYKPHGLFIPYALANLFVFVTLIACVYSYVVDGIMPGNTPLDFTRAASQSWLDLQLMVQIRFDNGSPYFLVRPHSLGGAPQWAQRAWQRIVTTWQVNGRRG
ncbi:hypothetical protein B0J11DRAFT_513479 [Dendryphion nanum]|uniref:Uncharacterized protein n=1 Tax=Dendryphion nanum TaxID=256645 RepID=A0A9P9J1L3_9PLEO|nr:hypothetical protein B0J11DRAFT_513479 [Dendryphion nanum]